MSIRVMITNGAGARRRAYYHRREGVSRRYYCVAMVAPAGLLEELLSAGFEDCSVGLSDEGVRNAFLRDYQAWMGNVSCQNTSRLWWATDISAKNYARIDLPDILFCVQYLIERFSSASEDMELLLVVPDRYIEACGEILSRCQGFQVVYGVDWWGLRVRKTARVVRLALKIGFDIGMAAGRIVLSRFYCGGLMERLKSRRDIYLVKSFFYNSAFNAEGGYRDAFFGRLIRHLEHSRDTVVMGVVVAPFIKTCRDACAYSGRTIFLPLELCLSLADLGRVLLDIVILPRPNISAPLFRGMQAGPLLQAEWDWGLKGVQVYQMLHYYAFRRTLSRADITTVLSTYEANPWEMMMGWAIKECGRPIELIGYQHTVIFDGFFGMFPTVKERDLMPLPQRILTAGAVTADWMMRDGAYAPGQVRPAAALRYEYLKGACSLERRPEVRRILVALDGSPETHGLVDYVLSQIGNDTRFEVVFRAHPSLSWPKLSRMFRYDLTRYRGCRVSSGGALTDDIRWADAVIYWSSTVSLEAVYLGRPVINVRLTVARTLDPLALTGALKWTVWPRSCLADTLSEIGQIPDVEFADRHRTAVCFVDDYFMAVTDDRLDLFHLVGRIEGEWSWGVSQWK